MLDFNYLFFQVLNSNNTVDNISKSCVQILLLEIENKKSKI